MSRIRASVATTLFASLLLSAPLARGQDKDACIAAHAELQRLHNKGKLHDARKQGVICASSACPSVVAIACTSLLGQVEGEQPTVVVSAQDSAGQDVVDVQVTVDGAVVQTKLDGRPFDVDPGEHVVVYSLADGRHVEAKVLIHSGERARVLRVVFPPATPESLDKAAPVDAKVEPDGQGQPPVTDRQPAAIPAPAWVLGGVGALGLAGFAYFGLKGRARESDLAGSCSPRCDPADTSVVQRDYRIADVALGVGVVSLGVATLLVLTRPAAPPPTAASSERATTFGVASIAGGGAAFLSGAF